MKIKWYAHAAVLFEGEGVRIIADPYEPELAGLAPILDPADVVIRSSADDPFHCYADNIPGNPAILTATELEQSGTTVRGVQFTPIHSQESLIYKEQPRENAMYRFTLDGIRVAHLDDVGNRLDDAQLAALNGVDVMLAPTGGPPTIDLDDLVDAIHLLKPRVFIPIHYQVPGLRLNILPVTAFTDRFPREAVLWHDRAEIEFSAQSLPTELRVVVLKPSTTLVPA